MTPIFVTGFGPFGQFDSNPSGWVAEELGQPFAVLPVSYAAVDAFLDDFVPSDTSAWLMFGVSKHAARLTLEQVGRNRIGPHPDIAGWTLGPAILDCSGPPNLAATLWHLVPRSEIGEYGERSVDAGDYLCNYLLYRALSRFPGLPIGFVHIPPDETMPRTETLSAARHLVTRLQQSLSEGA